MSERKVLNVSVGRLGLSNRSGTSRNSGRGRSFLGSPFWNPSFPTAFHGMGLPRLFPRLLPIAFRGGWPFAKSSLPGWGVASHLWGVAWAFTQSLHLIGFFPGNDPITLSVGGASLKY